MVVKGETEMKKIVGLLLALIFAFGMVACSNSPTSEGNNDQEKPNKVEQIVNGGSYGGNNYD